MKKLGTSRRSSTPSKIFIPLSPCVEQVVNMGKTPIPEETGSCMEVTLNSRRGKFKITNMADD